MNPTTEKQIKNGLRIGGGIGALFIAAMMIGIAVEGLQNIAPGHLRLWPDAIIASGLIGLAAVIMAFTARVWILYIGGCLLFAIPKLLIVAIGGRSSYSPHEPFSRFQAVELALSSLVALFLIYRLTTSHRPVVLDRFAFSFFFFALVMGLSLHNSSVIYIWQTAAVAALCLAWLLSRKKPQHRRITSQH